MQYAQQPQNILAVIYDGCIIFKKTMCRLWPLFLALFLIQGWVFMSIVESHAPEFDYHLTGTLMHQSLEAANLLISAAFFYLVLAMIWAAMDGFIRHGSLDWSNVFAKVRSRGLPLLLLWVLVSGLTMLGYVLMMVPALIIYVLFYQARFYVFLDGLGVLRSMNESAELVWGTSWWRTFTLFALIFLCGAAFLRGVYVLQPHMQALDSVRLGLAYVGIGVVGVLLEVLFTSWQLALFNDLKLRWVLPASDGSMDRPAS